MKDTKDLQDSKAFKEIFIYKQDAYKSEAFQIPAQEYKISNVTPRVTDRSLHVYSNPLSEQRISTIESEHVRLKFTFDKDKEFKENESDINPYPSVIALMTPFDKQNKLNDIFKNSRKLMNDVEEFKHADLNAYTNIPQNIDS